ncbi:hypothetical protein ACRAWD_06955 [Caulobacter segnis]
MSPAAIRATKSTSRTRRARSRTPSRSSQPGPSRPLQITLPVWICPTGVNCAATTTAGRTLNPNNPYAAAYANDPANGAARLYYLFGDIPAGRQPRQRSHPRHRGPEGRVRRRLELVGRRRRRP